MALLWNPKVKKKNSICFSLLCQLSNEYMRVHGKLLNQFFAFQFNFLLKDRKQLKEKDRKQLLEKTKKGRERKSEVRK